MESRNRIFMNSYQLPYFVISVSSFFCKSKKLNTTVIQPNYHYFTLGIKNKLLDLYRVISSPNSFKLKSILLFYPTLHSSQWQNKLNILIFLPWKFCIGDQRIKFLQWAIVSCCKNYILFVIVEILYDFSLIIYPLLNLELCQKFWSMSQHQRCMLLDL